MCRHASFCMVAVLACGSLQAQRDTGRDALSEYLEARGLDELLATHLDDLGKRSRAGLSTEQSERLAEAYARLLGRDGADPDDIERWEIASDELLSRLNETTAVSSSLRLALARSWYDRSVPAVSGALAGEIDPNAVAEAYRLLAGASEAFSLVGRRASQRADSLERRVDQNLQTFVGVDTEEELERSQRLKSEAFYYAGLSEHLLATLDSIEGRDPMPRAERSGDHFAWLFDPSQGRRERIGRLEVDRVRPPAAAHGAVVMSVNRAFAGEIAEARAWLDLVESLDQPPRIVSEELPSATMRVLALARRWDELSTYAQQRVDEGGLPVRDARLLATLAAQRAQAFADGREARDIAACVQIAVRALFEAGDVAHLVTLSRRFGDSFITGDGFLPTFVMALATIRLAEEMAASGQDASERYLRGASALERAIGSDDAGAFPFERAEAAIRSAHAFGLAGASAREVAMYRRAADLAQTEEQREVSLRNAIASIDVESESDSAVRETLVDRYRSLFPGTDFAVGLLLEDDERAGEAALDELVAVRPGSPVYVAARTLATQRLFEAWQNASAGRRAEAARRYRVVASELLRVRRDAFQSGDTRAGEAVGDLTLQMLAVSLSTRPVEADSASALLAELDRDINQRGLVVARDPGELAFRRLQLALATDDPETAEELESELERIGGRFGAAAATLVFDETVRRWRADATDAERAIAVVRVGQRVLSGMDNASDSAGRGVREVTASAAFAAWQITKDEELQSIARTLDERVLREATPTADGLRRLAIIEAARGQRERALDLWLRLLTAATPASELWLEARYESISLLARLDRAAAIRALEQYRVISDGWGPDPWAERFEDLAELLARPSGRAFDGRSR